MKINTVADAKKLNLTRSTQWLIGNAENRNHLESSHKQVMLNPKRKTMFVQGQDFRIALFVDNVAGSGDTIRSPRVRNSKNGKYTSIRHLAETLFSKNPDLTLEQWKSAMSKEYPKSASAGMKCYGHFCYYRHHLVMQGRFRCIPRPSWFREKTS
jgi:hypothetical protein